eukprot:2549401-Prymnesium_polylepis.1
MAAAALRTVSTAGSTLLLADVSDRTFSPATHNEENSPVLSWLPAPLPLGLRAIVAVTRDSPAHLELTVRDDVCIVELPPLSRAAALALVLNAGCPAPLSDRL